MTQLMKNITSPDKDRTESKAVRFDLANQSPEFDQQGTEKTWETFGQKNRTIIKNWWLPKNSTKAYN